MVFIALLYFGLELIRALSTMESGASSGIAHMAHIGGFIAAYALLPLVARGGPVELGVLDGGPVKAPLPSANDDRSRPTWLTSTIEDPWTAAGMDVPKHLRTPLKNLIQASDEPETRAHGWITSPMQDVPDMRCSTRYCRTFKRASPPVFSHCKPPRVATSVKRSNRWTA